MSTAGRSMRLALRMRVNISANGSVIIEKAPSPTGLFDARNQAIAGHVAKTDATDAELAINGARPPAQLATQPYPDAFAWRHLHFGIRLFAGFQLGQLFLEFDEFRFGSHVFPGYQPATAGINPAARLTFGVRAAPPYASRNGMPKDRNNSRASSSLLVLVTNVTSMPCTNVILSGSISGNTDCSLRPRL